MRSGGQWCSSAVTRQMAVVDDRGDADYSSVEVIVVIDEAFHTVMDVGIVVVPLPALMMVYPASVEYTSDS